MVTDADAIEILLQARGQEEVDAEARKTVQTWTDAFDLIKKAYPDPADMITNFKTMQDALSDIPGPDWSSLFDGLQESFTDATGTVDLAGWWNGIIEAMFASGIDVTQFVNDFASQIQDGLGDTIDVDFDVKLNTHDILDSINQIQQAIQEIAGLGKFSFDFNKVFDPDAVYELEAAIAQLTDQEVRKLYDALDRVYHTIEHLNINDTIKSDTLDQLQEYLDYIQKINEAHKETSGEGGNNLEQFLGRYKYALLLIGGAIGAIAGAIKYSSVFGTIMSTVGQAVGYLADVILMPLLPAMMVLVDWIIAAGDWFEKLPDPIKTVVSGIFMLVAAFLVLRAMGITSILSNIATGFLALGPVGWLAGGLLALAIAAYITNFGNFRDNFNQLISDILAGWDRLIHGDFEGTTEFAVKVVFDIVKISDDFSKAMNDVMSGVGRDAGEWFATGLLSLIWGIPKAIYDYIIGFSWEQFTQDLINVGILFGEAILEGIKRKLLGASGSLTQSFVSGIFGGAYEWGATNLFGINKKDADKQMKDMQIPILSDIVTPIKQIETIQKRVEEQPPTNNIIKDLNQSALLSGTNIDYSGLDINYAKLMQIKDAYTQLEDAQDTYNDALHGGNTYSDSTIKQLEENVQKAQDNIFNLTDSLYAVGDASSKAIQQTGDAVQKVSEATQKTYTLVTKEYYQPSVLLSSLPKEQQDKLTGMTEQKAIQKVVIEPQYSVMEKAMPDVLPKITEQTVIQSVSVVPDYTLQDKTPFNITDALNLKEQDVIQQISITPDYTVQDIPLPKVSPDITDQVITQPVTITPDYTVQDILIPDIYKEATLPDQELYQRVIVVPEYNLQNVPLPDTISDITEQVITQPVTITPDYLVKETNIPDLVPDLSAQSLKIPVSLTPEYQVTPGTLPEISAPAREITQAIGIVPEYSLVSLSIPDLIPTMPDVTRAQKVIIAPEYNIKAEGIPDITGMISPRTQEIIQSIKVTPDYILSDIPVPDIVPEITDNTIIQQVTVIHKYTVQDVPLPDTIPDITEQVITQPVTITPNYSVTKTEIPQVMDTITPEIQKIAIPVTIEPVINLIDTLTGSASMITQAFVQSALNIESSFGAMIETVKSKVEMLSESIKTAVSTDNSQIPISQSMPAGGQAQPAITNHNTYQNYFTVQGTTDVRKLAEEVARILDRGANSHRI
jgi:hypothetical protein